MYLCLCRGPARVVEEHTHHVEAAVERVEGPHDDDDESFRRNVPE